MPAFFLKICKNLHFSPISETIFLMIFGFGTYLISEILSLSGILSLLITSIVISHYAFYNLSDIGQQSSGVFFSTFSYLSEAFVFIYLGLCSLLKESDWSISFTAYSFLAVIIARFVGIFLTSAIFKLIYMCFKKKFELDIYELIVIFFSGTIRGAIAFGLVLSVNSKNVKVIKSTCLILVLFTTVVLGGMMGLVI